MKYLRDSEIRWGGREGRNVGGAVAEQGIEVKLMSRTNMAEQIKCALRHLSGIR